MYNEPEQDVSERETRRGEARHEMRREMRRLGDEAGPGDSKLATYELGTRPRR